MASVGGDDSSFLPPHKISSLSDAQEKIITLLPIIPALLSIFGSASILRLIHADGKHSPYRRILWAMSWCDILSSLVLACQAWLVPRETSQWVWAVGTQATCTGLGTLLQFSFAQFWYAGMLSFYFLFVIRYGWREERFARRVEPAMHVLAIGVPVITGIAGAVIGIFNEMEVGPGCWIADYPQNCGTSPGESGKTCRSTYYGYGFAGIPVLMVILCLCVNHFSIFFYVRQTTRRTLQSSMRGAEASRRQTRAVATQAFLYVGAFVICYVWPTILRVIESAPFYFRAKDQDRLFPLLCLQSLFLPLQGFLNLAVFLRPRLNLARQTFKHETWFWAVRRALYGEAVKPTAHNEATARSHTDVSCTNDFHSKITKIPSAPPNAAASLARQDVIALDLAVDHDDRNNVFPEDVEEQVLGSTAESHNHLHSNKEGSGPFRVFSKDASAVFCLDHISEESNSDTSEQNKVDVYVDNHVPPEQQGSENPKRGTTLVETATALGTNDKEADDK